MRRRTVLIAATTTALTVTGCSADAADESLTTPETVYAPGQRPAGPQLSGQLLDGTKFDPASVAAKVLVVNIWASWCAPCRAETDDLEAVYQATKSAGVEFLGFNLRDDKDAAQAFVRNRVAYPSLFDRDGRVTMSFKQVNASYIPSTVLLDRTGRVAVVYRRALVRDELEPVVSALAAEPI